MPCISHVACIFGLPPKTKTNKNNNNNNQTYVFALDRETIVDVTETYTSSNDTAARLLLVSSLTTTAPLFFLLLSRNVFINSTVRCPMNDCRQDVMSPVIIEPRTMS